MLKNKKGNVIIEKAKIIRKLHKNDFEGKRGKKHVSTCH